MKGESRDRIPQWKMEALPIQIVMQSGKAKFHLERSVKDNMDFCTYTIRKRKTRYAENLVLNHGTT